MGFKGNVESLSLADVFQNLGQSRQTGTLHVFTPHGEEKWAWFADGRLIGAVAKSRCPFTVLDVLRGRGVISVETVEKAKAAQQTSGRPLWECLVETGDLAAERLRELTCRCVELEVCELFGWEAAQYEFEEGAPAPELLDGNDAPPAAELELSNVIMEAARRMDEWERFRKRIPSFSEVYTMDEDIRQAFESGSPPPSAEEKRTAALLDGGRDVDDLIADTGYFRYEIMEILAGFLQASLIRPARIDELDAKQRRWAEEGNKERQAKLLERMLVLGDERPESRRMLAETLAALEISEKAAVHFAVLADDELQRGNEEAAVALYRQVVVLVPHHLNARARLADIHLRQNRKAEALIHLRELGDAYAERRQWPEARDVYTRALSCDPSHLELRRKIIEACLKTGDKKAAAAEWEKIGDYFADAARNKEAADAYRHAMQLVPQTKHLAGKFAAVRLSDEERQARTKRRTVALSLGAAAIIAAALAATLEYRNYAGLRKARRAASAAEATAKKFEAEGRFDKAAKKYEEAKTFFLESTKVWSPFMGTAAEARQAMNNWKTRAAEAADKWDRTGREGLATAHEDFERARSARNAWRLEDALRLCRKVLDNRFSSSEMKTEARSKSAEIVRLLKEFRAGVARMALPFAKAFPGGLKEEYEFKRSFLNKFSGLLAARRRKKPKTAPVVLVPVLMRSKTLGVKVFMDGTLTGEIGPREDVFRFPADGAAHRFEFKRRGYGSVAIPTESLKSSVFEVVMKRVAAQKVKLAAACSGRPTTDNENRLWVGTTKGEVLRLRPENLAEEWRWRAKGTKETLNRRIFGGPYVFKGEKGLLVCFARQDGTCAAVRIKTKKLLWRRKVAAFGLEVPPVLIRLEILPGKPVLAVADGKTLRLLDAETGMLVGGEKITLPVVAATSPTAVTAQDMVVVGCRDGTLRGWSVRRKRWAFVWQTGAPFPPCGRPVVAGRSLVAGGGNGSLYFFGMRGGNPLGAAVRLPGAPTSPPVSAGSFLYYGCSGRGALCAVDYERRSLRWAQRADRGQVDGEVLHSPAVGNGRVYCGTTKGVFYAFDLKNGRELWRYEAGARKALSAPPAVAGKRVFFFCTDGTVYAFDE